MTSYNHNEPRVSKGSFRNLRNTRNNLPIKAESSDLEAQISDLSPTNSDQEMVSPASPDAWIRKQWKTGSKVEVYSNSARKWFEGDVTRIFYDTEGEWLEVQYAIEVSKRSQGPQQRPHQLMRLKQIPRDDKDAIRPIPKSMPIYSASSSSSSSPQQQSPESAMFATFKPPGGSFNASAFSTDGGGNGSGGPTLSASGVINGVSNGHGSGSGDKSPEDMTQEDIDEQIRKSWVRGSRVEVYSRGRKKWMRGLVTKVFFDDEGEWLEVRYGKNLVKETPRDSPDIRPLRVRYKNRFKFTRDHENTVTAIWEEVDLENTRYLDRLLVNSVFRALNIDSSIISESEVDDVFKWIDKEDRGAVNFEEFINWMTSSVETVQQREIQQKMFQCIDRIASGQSQLSHKVKVEEQKKLAAIYKTQYSKQIKPKSPSLTSKFTPAPDLNPFVLNEDANTERSKAILNEFFKNQNAKKKQDDFKEEVVDHNNGDGPDLGHDVITAEPMDIDEIAEFSGPEDDDEAYEDQADDDDDDTLGDLGMWKKKESKQNNRGGFNLNGGGFGHSLGSGLSDDSSHGLSSFKSSNNSGNGDDGDEKKELHSKLKDVGFSEKFLVATVASQKEEYHSKIKPELRIHNEEHRRKLEGIQKYMKERVKKAGVDGLRMSELGNALARKYKGFQKKHYLSSSKATLSDFVSLCPGLVVVEMEGSNKRMERIAVTDSCALKINLKSKLQFVLTMLFDKGKITNNLEPIKLERDKYGRIQKNRRLSVGERLITVKDFTDRIRSLGVDFNELEGDELFWAVAGSNSTMISQKMVGRYFSSLIDHLSDPIEPEVAKVLPKVIDLARLKYRREPLWKKYIIKQTICRWNNISYLRLTDRRTRSKMYDMIVIPRTKSVHGGDVIDVQKSFHYTCHILNKLQYPTICKKIDHGSDKFNFCCVTKTPHLRSFPEMLNEAINKRNICYSEYFVSQVIGCILETIVFCHKHDTVNFNLNIDNLGFDNNLRPILLDFSRSIVLGEEDKISRFFSVMSSTPPELALLMGSNNPLMNIELNGSVLRKADSWRCGVLLYCMITGRLPYHATSLGNFITQVLTLPPVLPIEELTWISEELKDLLYKLLETTYFNRIDIKEALKHEWFTKIAMTSGNQQSLPTDVIDNIINLCKLENARNWISTITHKGYAENKQLDRDRKYFGRLDPTGQRKSLKKSMLITFIMDRLGYCQYRANQIVEEYHSECDENGITWKDFVSTYIDIQWNESDKVSQTKQFTNAIFRGLDPNGDGCVASKLLLMLFEDINLKLQSVVNKLTTLQKFTFEQTVTMLSDAFRAGFDIGDLLSVDHSVQSL